MKTIRFKPENFDLLLQGPTVKSTTIRAGDKTARFHVGERVECRDKTRAVECEVTGMELTTLGGIDETRARADGFESRRLCVNELLRLNRRKEFLADHYTIIGLRIIGEVRDTRFEVFDYEELGKIVRVVGAGTQDYAGRRLVKGAYYELARRQPEVQA